MHRSPFARSLLLATGGLAEAGPAAADFLSDGKGTLELRNFYFNRDFRQDGAPQAKAEEWAQGFLLRLESGYTEGTIGVGVDALGLLGVKLDSGAGRSGSGLLKRDRETGEAQDEYGELGMTAKLRASKSTLKVGTLQPKLPSVLANDSRLLPQTFQGVHLNSRELDGLTLDAGRLRRVNQRDSSNYEEMTLTILGAKNISIRSGTSSDHFDFAGLSYQWSDRLTTAYHYGALDGFYRQHSLNLVHLWPLAEGHALKTDLRYSDSSHDGSSNVDNRAFGAMFTYSLGAHTLGAGYQAMRGDTGFAYINGTDAALVNFVQIGDFANKDETSWQLRYDYDFAALGLPGLSFMTRYLSGDGIDLGAGRPEGKEWERDTDIGYVVQSGPLKNLGIRWRNATVRSSHFGNDLDENRLILSYSLALW
nr:outer membrane porin, OprD family [Gammaproteobacteria bacterium]